VTATEPEFAMTVARLATGVTIIVGGGALSGFCYWKALSSSIPERRSLQFLAGWVATFLFTVIFGALVMSGAF
jgi:hypothetical protein